MTRRDTFAAIALLLAVLALWALATWAFTVRVMAAGNAGIEYEWKGERV